MRFWTGTVTITRTWTVPIGKVDECKSADEAIECVLLDRNCGDGFDDETIDAVSSDQLRPEPERS